MLRKLLSKRKETIRTAALVFAGLWLSTASTSIFAANFSVNSFTNASDNNTTDDICAVAGGGCTLRAAIMQANALAGEDTISVPAGTYELSIKGVDGRCDDATPDPTPCTIDGITGAFVPVITSDASKGDLDITDDVTITGAGSDQTIIKWVDLPTGDTDPLSGDRIFHVAVPADATADIASVVIQGLTVVNGEVGLKPTVATDVCIDDGIDDGLGTTVYTPDNLNAYDIPDTNTNTDLNCGTLDDEGKLVGGTIIIDQFRRMGGGIALGGGYAVVTYDEANAGSPPDDITGGEGSSFGIESVSLNDVVIINNWSGADGGGIHSIVPATISQSKISGNTSAGGNGGGLYNEANLTISDTLIGKVINADTPVAHPELRNQNSAENGGGIFFTGSPNTSITILRSAINGNYAIGGGGIAGREAEFNITNTTISSNTARDIGAGITTSGDVVLLNVTVADNVATTPATNGGAGLNAFGNGSFTMSNTLLSNNKVEYVDKPTRRDNCGCVGNDCTPLFISQGYNLEDRDTCQFDVTFKFDQIDTDPLLAALADNGGLTETHAITHSAVSGAVDSPAVDAGNNVNCPNSDQRGSIRPADGNRDGTKNCDIGAFELFEVTPDLQISNMVAPDTATTGNNFAVTVTVSNGSVDSDSSVVLVTDALPSIVTFVSATTTAGTCAEVSGVVTCTIGDLDGTSSATVTLTLTASAAGDATITASVTSTNEPDASVEPNNSASVLTKIGSTSDSNSSSSSGCSLSYNPDGSVDPLLPALVIASLIYLGWRMKKREK